MNAQLRTALEAQAEKHEILGQDFANLMEWAEIISIQAGLLKNIEQGFLEVVGMKESDNPMLSITDKGTRYVESMPRLVEELVP